MRRIVCFSGGHSSALVAVEVARRYGNDEMILVNHDISAWVEDEDIKRFKAEVANYLGLQVTYVNYKGLSVIPDQFDICVKNKAFKTSHDTVLCTSRLKTEPFNAWLDEYATKDWSVVYYGFDKHETERIQRRSTILAAKGFRTDYPIAYWKRTIYSTNEININPPLTYNSFKHANCVGCIKAGKQHWYVVFINRPDIWEKAKWAEEEIGYSIIKDFYLSDLEPFFQAMKDSGVQATEHVPQQKFWIDAKRLTKGKILAVDPELEAKPCECVI
jgi:3'-phosphoadenosine 5'-phosphosulfate sulfotransferase (PAPS reductase)/FAD synthetase